MAFRPEFQPLCGEIIHRDPVPSLDSAISDLLAKETHLHSLSYLASTSTSGSETVLAVAPWFSSSGGPRTTTTTTTRLYCTICKRTGHTDCLCRHPRFCNHCKKTGHTEPRVFQSLFRVTSSGTIAEKATGTSSPSYFYSMISRHVSWYNSIFTVRSFRYSTSTCSDWITAPAPVSIQRVFCLGLLYYLGYVFSLNFRF